MVSEKKKQMLKEVKAQVKEYPVVGIINMHNLPARQLHDIRNKLREEAVIRMVKKRIMAMALEQSGEPGLRELTRHIQGEPALLLSKTDPFKLARKLEKSKSPAPAKAGDTAPKDIVIKAGPTKLPPGPVIGELQKAKLPAGVQGDKINIMKDTTVAREGEEISPEIAGALGTLGIEPMEIGLNLVAASEEGVVYPSDVLFVPLEEYENQLKDAVASAFNLSVSINHFTPETVPFLIAKAGQEAASLAYSANIVTPETIGSVLAKASAEADALAAKAGLGS